MIEPGQRYSIREDGKWEMFLDATMAGTFGLCEAMYEESFINNLTPKGDRPFARDLGSWWSQVMENIYGSYFKENQLSGQDIASLALRVWNELNMDELEKFHPRSFKEFGGRLGAMTMISEYAVRQLPIDYSTWKIVAAEASFGRNKEVCIGETDKTVLYWMGQPDLYVIFNNRFMPVDHKSVDKITPWIQKKYKPHIQLPGYIIAGQILLKSLGYDYPIDRCIVNCVARSDSTSKDESKRQPRFKRFFISYSPEELAEWKKRRLDQADRLRMCIETKHFAWNEYACSNTWGKACAFQNIHEKPPEARQIVRIADYTVRKPWIPGRTEKEKAEAKANGEI